MSSSIVKSNQRRRKVTPSSTPTEDKPILLPTPPPGRRPSSTSSRSSTSRPGTAGSGSLNSVGSASDMSNQRISRQNTLLAPLNTEDGLKCATTIGRYHTIVPPIKQQNVLSSATARPISRSYSIMAETPINLKLSDEFAHEDDHAINSVTEENYPTASPRLDNPLVRPRYIETPSDPAQSVQTPRSLSTNNNNIVEHPHKLPTIPSEPTEDSPRLKLAVKLLDGSRIDRYFSPDDHIQAVVDFASVHMGSLLEGYFLRSRDCRYTDLTVTLQECQIQDRTLLFLEPPDR